ncbi:MAG: SCO family protein [Gammaproteobacteria bacterium HGW-Gammaproteobacteria-1]|jgi:protein SCO1/2|nr:MAG: SCO family protein [Gammaproteobacteria bacterium HGW-Gammaproteobacteria-1]
MKFRLWAASASLVLLLAALVGTFFWHPAEQEESPQGGGFVLNTNQGTLRLEQLRNKVVILYFGYTWCPDVCPTSLALLGMALHKLEPRELAVIQPLFISVDPERDTVERLAEYTAYFHPALKGATGTPQQIADLARRYGVAYRREEGGSATDYTVDHSSLTFLLDRQGQIVEVLPHGTSPDKIAAAIRNALALQP